MAEHDRPRSKSKQGNRHPLQNKGINLPDAHLSLPGLTFYDRNILPFICRHADLVGYSFVRQASDLDELQQEMIKYDRQPDIILKIETPAAVKNLPSLLIQGMRQEAAHSPVIWATQVLETLNKSGIATRSEITDASYAAQAECVMLNKGDYIITVINTLTDILRRSGGHHAKKRYMFRPMHIASDYLNSEMAPGRIPDVIQQQM